MYPEVHFHLVDSINKKLTVAANVAEAIGLNNISLRHCRVEEEKDKFDFVVSRAVMPLKDLVKLSAKNVASKGINALPNGIICLKGGELQEEIKPFRNIATVIDLDLYFEEEFFKTKKVIYVPV
jgi:16S rRNA (guanine527-N7)-methyltransferase